jgi:hypothetical protein
MIKNNVTENATLKGLKTRKIAAKIQKVHGLRRQIGLRARPQQVRQATKVRLAVMPFVYRRRCDA